MTDERTLSSRAVQDELRAPLWSYNAELERAGELLDRERAGELLDPELLAAARNRRLNVYHYRRDKRAAARVGWDVSSPPPPPEHLEDDISAPPKEDRQWFES